MAKTKYIMHDCAYCHKQTKMELVGGMPTENQEADPQRLWYRCTRCKHSALLTLASVEKDKKANGIKIDRSTCIEYSKDKIFTIGQVLYHSDLNDVGRVTKKDKTSNGIHSITVSFENVGERKLLENVKSELTDEITQSTSTLHV